MSEKEITLRQLVEVLRGEITWLRIYPNGQRIEYTACMSDREIREAVAMYGARAVRRVYPGYGFVMIYTD